jgi:hypothetical protein
MGLSKSTESLIKDGKLTVIFIDLIPMRLGIRLSKYATPFIVKPLTLDDERVEVVNIASERILNCPPQRFISRTGDLTHLIDHW